MPIIKSAKKRVRVARRARSRNVKTKRELKTALKLFTKTPSAKSQSAVQSQIDKALKKNVIHKNKAARLKKRAAQAAKAKGVKATKAAPTKKPAAKKAAPKKKS